MSTTIKAWSKRQDIHSTLDELVRAVHGRQLNDSPYVIRKWLLLHAYHDDNLSKQISPECVLHTLQPGDRPQYSIKTPIEVGHLQQP